MSKIIILFTLFSVLHANTIITLKDGTSIESEIDKVHSTVLRLTDGKGIMLKLIESVKTSDKKFIDEIRVLYPLIPVEKLDENRFRLDFSAVEVKTVEEQNNQKQPFINSYSFNFMLNTQRRHFLELNARIFTTANWYGEIGYSHGDESIPDAIITDTEKSQVDFTTESFALGFGKAIDIKVGQILPSINFWLSSSNANLQVKDDQLLQMANVNELVISPSITFLKRDKGGLLQLMAGVRYFFNGILLDETGWYIDEKYYPTDKSMLKRGFSIHLGVGINLKVR
jgi:hypothetical protein